MQRIALSLLALAIAGPALAAADTIAPPAGAKQILEASADGVQIYACEASDAGAKWVFKGPEATLFDAHGRQIGTHGKGPSWTLSDGSSITAELTAKEPSPDKSAIPWLLLTVKSHDGSGALADAAFVRRVDTKGGVEPAGSCEAGKVARMRYSATYQFFAR